jgi:hypothetical protein
MEIKPKGRPKKPKDGQRTDTLRIRLTDNERADLDREANRRGLETSTWARMILIETARPGISRTGG